eukprot:scpid101173/ scgid34618/ 
MKTAFHTSATCACTNTMYTPRTQNNVLQQMHPLPKICSKSLLFCILQLDATACQGYCLCTTRDTVGKYPFFCCWLPVCVYVCISIGVCLCISTCCAGDGAGAS